MKLAATLIACSLIFASNLAAAQSRTSVLFIGNSFTYAHGSPVHFYRAATVTDLNDEGVGGVPALFKSFADQAGLDYDVWLETRGGAGLDFHLAEKSGAIGERGWDLVVMHGYSTLDADKPRDPAKLVATSKQMADLLRTKNPGVAIYLMATWSRADQTYPKDGAWAGQPIEAMARDLRTAYDSAARAAAAKAVIPVGEAWLRAMRTGVADPNPYDGVEAGKLDLWTYDHYHGSTYGYYLEALVIFATLTGRDPRSLGDTECSAFELGLSRAQAGALQQVAFDELAKAGSVKPSPRVIESRAASERCAALGVARAQPAAPPAPPPRVLSPEIAVDGKVTFRIRAAEAKAVALASGGDLPQIPFGQTLPLQKGADGVWSLTIGPVSPGAYRYAFVVDGVSVVDPAQARVSESNDNTWSLFTVPGAKFMDTLDVPHGSVAEVRYYSAELRKWRRMHVYTPPGYGMTQKRYPVLYLLHGAFDSDASWSTVGREADIIDNLIAEGRAAPMLVAMPAGHTGPFNRGAAAGLGIDEFVREFERDIRPFVERSYPVQTGPRSTAIAGLSMGGAQTLEIAIKHLKDFGYVGVFSSGVLGGNGASAVDDWGAKYAAQLDDKSARSALKLLWFSTGKDDRLLPTTTATVALFEKHGFQPTFKESAGGHTWINWREYLSQFAPQLFK